MYTIYKTTYQYYVTKQNAFNLQINISINVLWSNKYSGNLLHRKGTLLRPLNNKTTQLIGPPVLGHKHHF